jgi:hypothetical protein
VGRGAITARRVFWRSSPDTGDSIDLPAHSLRSFGSLALPILGVSLRSLRLYAAIPLLWFEAGKTREGRPALEN